jgi:hypothetical protein
MSEIPKASHDGDLKLAGTVIKAAVLPDGKRLITQGTLLLAIGRSRTPKAGTGGLTTVDDLPFFLQAEQLKPFISKELRESTTPFIFKLKNGQKAVGYEAKLLPMICEVYLNFRDSLLESEKPIPKKYAHIIKACDILMRGLAHVGIVALVDEATGYQEIRDRKALQDILDKYLLKELAAWAKRFPDEFYRQIFRLRGWEWRGMKINRPSVVGHYTNDLVYERLAPGILDELKRRMPKNESGQDKGHLHRLLTEEVGHPALQAHLAGIMALQRAAPNNGWGAFHRMVERAYPKFNETPPFNLGDE